MTLLINEPESGIVTELADGNVVVSLVFTPCPVCSHSSQSTGGCYHCKPSGGVCLPCVYRGNPPVGTGVNDPPAVPPPGA